MKTSVARAEDVAAGALRAEHDSIADRLTIRRSIDLARWGAYLGFAGCIAGGFAVKLGYDRWFSTRLTRFRGPPIFFYLALVLTAVLLVVTASCLWRARRRMRDEDAQFARMRELRAQLQLDP